MSSCIRCLLVGRAWQLRTSRTWPPHSLVWRAPPRACAGARAASPSWPLTFKRAVICYRSGCLPLRCGRVAIYDTICGSFSTRPCRILLGQSNDFPEQVGVQCKWEFSNFCNSRCHKRSFLFSKIYSFKNQAIQSRQYHMFQRLLFFMYSFQ